MFRSGAKIIVVLATALVGAAGCAKYAKYSLKDEADTAQYEVLATQIEYPDVSSPLDSETAGTIRPVTVRDPEPAGFRDMTLEEAVHLALGNSQVLRDIGGVIVKPVSSLRTVHDPAIQESDPRFGVEAALSAFDAQIASSTFVENNDKALNNVFFGGGTRTLKQDAVVFQSQITKRSATGAELTLRNITDYDANNAPGNAFPSAWNMIYEGVVRQPLLQGAGQRFNGIAGPSDTPGVNGGVLIARVNTDISIAEFETGVRDLVGEVENAYWDLYFAYRDLDAKVTARNKALETWRSVNALYVTGRRGGEAEKEAQAREQHFRFEEDVLNALSGRLVDSTRLNNGSNGGTFRAVGGVHVSERRLRLLIGLAISDGFLIRPADEPVKAKVVYDWNTIVQEAVQRRVEIRKQKWLIKRRELELEASKNFLKPQLDAIGRYRFRGFGHDLFEQYENQGPFGDAFSNLTSFDFQEWQLGVEYSVPLGKRRALSGIRNAEFHLARDRAILREMERDVVHNLSAVVGEVDRSYAVIQTSYNRRQAAREQLNAVEAAYEVENAPLDLVLDAQRRVAEADSRYYAALVDYSVAIKNVQFEKGTILEYNEVFLSEGAWPLKAYSDAARLEASRNRPLHLKDEEVPYDFSPGPFPADTLVEPVLEEGEAYEVPGELPVEPESAPPAELFEAPIEVPPEPAPVFEVPDAE